MVWLAASQSGAEDQYIPSDSLPVAIFESVEADLAGTHWQGLATEMPQRRHPKPQRSLERDVVGNVPKDKLCGSWSGEAKCCIDMHKI